MELRVRSLQFGIYYKTKQVDKKVGVGEIHQVSRKPAAVQYTKPDPRYP